MGNSHESLLLSGIEAGPYGYHKNRLIAVGNAAQQATIASAFARTATNQRVHVHLQDVCQIKMHMLLNTCALPP